MLTGVSVPMELESGVQYLELWYGIWRTAPGAARCSFVPCCGSFVRARALRSLFQFVPFGARARTHTLLGFTFPGGPVSVISRGRRTLFPRSSPPPRILDDRIYDKRHCCCRARAMRPSSRPRLVSLPPNRWPMPATLFAVECRYPPMPPPRLLVRPAHTRSHLVVNPISSHPPTPLRNSLALGASRTDVDAHRIVARARSLQSWLLMRVCFLPSLPLWLCS